MPNPRLPFLTESQNEQYEKALGETVPPCPVCGEALIWYGETMPHGPELWRCPVSLHKEQSKKLRFAGSPALVHAFEELNRVTAERDSARKSAQEMHRRAQGLEANEVSKLYWRMAWRGYERFEAYGSGFDKKIDLSLVQHARDAVEITELKWALLEARTSRDSWLKGAQQADADRLDAESRALSAERELEQVKSENERLRELVLDVLCGKGVRVEIYDAIMARQPLPSLEVESGTDDATTKNS